MDSRSMIIVLEHPGLLLYEKLQIFFSQHVDNTPVETVGEKWVYNFVQRNPELSSRFSRRYNYERAKCEDPKMISEWFTSCSKNYSSIRYRS